MSSPTPPEFPIGQTLWVAIMAPDLSRELFFTRATITKIVRGPQRNRELTLAASGQQTVLPLSSLRAQTVVR